MPLRRTVWGHFLFMAILRLDHIIATVDSIDAWHRHLTADLGFPEAWPVGPFWPNARTSGVAIGGLNLELIQPDAGHPGPAEIRTLVFEPIHATSALDRLAKLEVPANRFEKVEPDPELLRLRGFPADQVGTPQPICTNVLPEGPTPFDFFFCDYAPFLRDRLGPRALVSPHGSVVSLTLSHPEPDVARHFLTDLGGGDLPFQWVLGLAVGITEIALPGGLDVPLQLPATFRFTRSAVS